MENSSPCYCGSGALFDACCAPILSGERLAQTAEELLRARFSAFPTQNVDFLIQTHHMDTRHEVKREELEEWMQGADWIRLEIHQVQGGSEKDQEGILFFTAYHKDKENDAEEQKHSEKSIFKKMDGEWRFWDAEGIHFGTYQRSEPKIGRNDPCPCGSEKKYKRCCA